MQTYGMSMSKKKGKLMVLDGNKTRINKEGEHLEQVNTSV